VDKIKALLDELASVTAQIQAAMEQEEAPAAEGDAEAVAAEENSLRSLMSRADAIKAKIDFLEKVAEKEKELRSVLERSAPAKAIETPEAKEPTVEKRTEYAVPKPRATSSAMPRPVGGARITASAPNTACRPVASIRSAAF